MNPSVDVPRQWLAHSAQDVATVQTQLRKGLLPHAPGFAPSAGPPARYLVTRAVFAIPVLHDGAPDTVRCAEGITIDVGEDGVTFELATATRPASPKWLLGIERDHGDLGFVTVSVKHLSQAGLGLRVTATLVEPPRDPLSEANLTPSFDSQSFTFRTKLSPAALKQWQALGVVQSRLLDRVLACPRCCAMPTFRRACRACGSIAVSSRRLIHHFACAHVDLVANFQFDTEIACPKCRARKLVVGSDFEYLDSPFDCADCNWTDSELATIGRCGACGNEFPVGEAAEKQVIGYHVDRLELLDLVAAD